MARIVEALPEGDRVALDEPVVIRFSEQGDVPKLKQLVTEPSTDGSVSWPNSYCCRMAGLP